MNELSRNSANIYNDYDVGVAARLYPVREVISGDYYIPSTVLRKIIDDVARASTKPDTLDALDAVLKTSMHYEVYLKKGSH